MKLKLEASNDNEKRVLAYLEENASQALTDKINAGTKTLKDCFRWIAGQVRAKAVNGCACIEDKEVYGLAVHYFEEDSIYPASTKSEKNNSPAPQKQQAPVHKAKVVEFKPKEAKPVKKPVAESDGGQFSIDDWLGGLT